MDCLMCGRAAGFNRALVDVASGRRLGRLCRNCEVTHFGRRLAAPDGGSDACAFCHRDGRVALPAFRAIVVEEGGRLVSINELAPTETAPRVCEDHVDRMRDYHDAPAEGGSATDGAVGGAI